jgi:Cytochrome P460
MIGRTIALLLSATALLSPPVLRESGTPASGPEFTQGGELKLPEGYREWIYLTSGFDMSYTPGMQMGDQHKFDNVFVNPEAYKAFVNTGTWPDKTILVLEQRVARSKGSINQSGNFQADAAGLELHVKDETRFPGKWAFFAFGGRKTATAIPASARLLQLSRPTCGGGHHLCPVLSHPAAHRQRKAHAFPLLPEGGGHTGQPVAYGEPGKMLRYTEHISTRGGKAWAA